MKMKKYILGIGAAAAALVLPLISFAQVSTTTLGTAIDSVNGTWYDYFQVLLTHYWPFVVGAGILVLVWHFGRRLLNAFT